MMQNSEWRRLLPVAAISGVSAVGVVVFMLLSWHITPLTVLLILVVLACPVAVLLAWRAMRDSERAIGAVRERPRRHRRDRSG